MTLLLHIQKVYQLKSSEILFILNIQSCNHLHSLYSHHHIYELKRRPIFHLHTLKRTLHFNSKKSQGYCSLNILNWRKEKELSRAHNHWYPDSNQYCIHIFLYLKKHFEHMLNKFHFRRRYTECRAGNKVYMIRCLIPWNRMKDIEMGLSYHHCYFQFCEIRTLDRVGDWIFWTLSFHRWDHDQ